jgi:hypothetical protein
VVLAVYAPILLSIKGDLRCVKTDDLRPWWIIAASCRRDSVVNPSNIPQPHPDPWVDLLRGYVSQAVRALAGNDLQVRRSWLDPCDPRDATIVYVPRDGVPDRELALVWDEETGTYESGEQGVRTELGDAAFVGGGALVDPRELAERLLDGTTAPRRAYRSYTDLRDGLDDALRDQRFAR